MVRYIKNSKKEEVMVSKKELVLRAFRGEEVDRVPVGFWFHFVSQEEKMLGLDNPVIFNKSVEGACCLCSSCTARFCQDYERWNILHNLRMLRK